MLDTFIHDVLPPLVTFIVTAFLGWMGALLQKYAGVKIEQVQRDALHQALTTGILTAFQKLGRPPGTVEERANMIAHAIEYANRSVPEKIRALDPPVDLMAQIAASKIPQLNNLTPNDR
jgi:hypothetical protein